MPLSWSPILARAAEVALEFQPPPTLRQLFYRLVSEGLLANEPRRYKALSRETAKARRAGRFPALTDNTRRVEVARAWPDAPAARTWLRTQFRLPRDRGQEWLIFVAAEKDTMSAFLRAWFAELGVRTLTLRGYSSEPLVEQARSLIQSDGRPAVLIYAGDHDPTGEDIDRDFVARVGAFTAVERVALAWDQVLEHNLPPALGKASDPRAASFAARHGRLVQVELEALRPDVLRGLYRSALGHYWDQAAHERVLEAEAGERAAL